MKERILKIAMPLLLAAVLIAAGVYPITSSQAAAKGTTYNVVIQSGSPNTLIISVNGGAPASTLVQNEGITFQMIVDAKAKTEKLKTGAASYYPVTILKKTYKGVDQELTMVSVGPAIKRTVLGKDSKGKLYISGGDVDISQVLAKKLITKIGDGTVDPAGSMVITLNLNTDMIAKSNGKVVMTTASTYNFTTGKTYTVAQGSGTRLEGKAMPNDDPTKSVPTPLVGQPIDLEKGTGTLVSTMGGLKLKNKLMGLIDNLSANIMVMKITKQ